MKWEEMRDIENERKNRRNRRRSCACEKEERGKNK